MNKLFIYLKQNNATQTFDLYLNGIYTTSYPMASLPLIPLHTYLTNVKKELEECVFATYRRASSLLKFTKTFEPDFKKWLRLHNLVFKQPVEIIITGLTEDKLNLVQFKYEDQEEVKQAILVAKESFKHPKVTKDAWVQKII